MSPEDELMWELFAAAEAGDAQRVRRCLDRGGAANTVDPLGRTPLGAALFGCRVDVIRILLAAGADPNNLGSSTLPGERIPVLPLFLPLLRLMVEYGVDVNRLDTEDDLCPLHRAVVCGDIAAAQYLLDAGADIDRVGADGATPLFLAARRGDLDMVRFLKSRGASAAVVPMVSHHWHLLVPYELALYRQVLAAQEACYAEAGFEGHRAWMARLRESVFPDDCDDSVDGWSGADGFDDGFFVEMPPFPAEEEAPISANEEDISDARENLSDDMIDACPDDPAWIDQEREFEGDNLDSELYRELLAEFNKWVAEQEARGQNFLSEEEDPDEEDVSGKPVAAVEVLNGWSAAEHGDEAVFRAEPPAFPDEGEMPPQSVEEDVPDAWEVLEEPPGGFTDAYSDYDVDYEDGGDPTAGLKLARENYEDLWTDMHPAERAWWERQEAQYESWRLACTPLHDAIVIFDVEYARFQLEQRGADPNLPGSGGVTPLMLVQGGGPEEETAAILQLLLAHGADPNVTDSLGCAALHYAARRYFHQEDAVRLLLEAGANPNAAAFDGWTPLHELAYQGATEAAAVLLDAGAEPDLVDRDGWTPLMWAARMGHSKTVAVLLGRGAEPGRQDSEGRNAYDHGAPFPDVIAVLQNYSAAVE